MAKSKLGVTTRDAIKITGYTSQRLNQLVKDEIISKDKHGNWDLKKLFKEVCDHKIKLAIEPLQKELQKLREADPDYRLKNIKANDADLDFQIKQKKLLYEESILDFLKKFGHRIITAFEPIGRECQNEFKFLKDDIEKANTVVKIKDKILDAIATTNITTLLPDSFRNPASDIIKNRKRISKRIKAKAKTKH